MWNVVNRRSSTRAKSSGPEPSPKTATRIAKNNRTTTRSTTSKRTPRSFNELGTRRKNKKHRTSSLESKYDEAFAAAKCSALNFDADSWEPQIKSRVEKFYNQHRWVPPAVLYNIAKLLASDEAVLSVLEKEERRDRDQFGRGNVGRSALVKSADERRRAQQMHMQKRANTICAIDRKELRSDARVLFTRQEIVVMQEKTRKAHVNRQAHSNNAKAAQTANISVDIEEQAHYLDAIAHDMLRKLKEAVINSEDFRHHDTIDLHAMNAAAAVEVVARALTITKFQRRLSVITGKGIHSSGAPVLKSEVQKFLKNADIEYAVKLGNEGRLELYPNSEPRNWGLGEIWARDVDMWRKDS